MAHTEEELGRVRGEGHEALVDGSPEVYPAPLLH